MRESLEKAYRNCSKTDPWCAPFGKKGEGKKVARRMVRSRAERELYRELREAELEKVQG